MYSVVYNGRWFSRRFETREDVLKYIRSILKNNEDSEDGEFTLDIQANTTYVSPEGKKYDVEFLSFRNNFWFETFNIMKETVQ